MTDPAPPARTALTPEEMAWKAYQDCDHPAVRDLDDFHVCQDCISAALTLARSEGRRERLEEAATAFSRIGADDGRGAAMLMSCGWVIQKLRGLATEAPQAHKDLKSEPPMEPTP